jgi:twitching motility protein PilT
VNRHDAPRLAAQKRMEEYRLKLMYLLKAAIDKGGSDLYLVPGAPATLKINAGFEPFSQEKMSMAQTRALIEAVYEMAGARSSMRLEREGDDDFSFSVKGIGRFRCSAYKQRGSLAAVLRVVPFGLPDYRALSIPETVMDLSTKKRGMVLVTGPGGSGKSTTLACIIDRINRDQQAHIITLEDPIEYLHPHRRAIISQREIAQDTTDFAHALRASLRQAPDVILLGEMRDFETIQTALTAAETGHLLLSSLHTLGAAKTIDRIIDVFPANQQQQVRIQLSMVLLAVVSQQLIPTQGGGLTPAMEIMLVNSAISNMIREGKGHQINNAIYAGSAQGMITMDEDIMRLYKQGSISRDNALLYAVDPDTMSRKL